MYVRAARRDLGPLVCRWNLQRGLRDGQARGLFEPFDRLRAPDPLTRRALAKVMLGTIVAGPKAEGCAPLSVLELARGLGVQLEAADWFRRATPPS